MTTEFLIKASKIIEDGLRMPAKPEEEPRPCSCPWVCPNACLNCTVVNCADRLAGGGNEIS